MSTRIAAHAAERPAHGARAGASHSHRRQAGPVRKTAEVVISGAAGMALVGSMLALLHAGGVPPAAAAETPTAAPRAAGSPGVQLAAPITISQPSATEGVGGADGGLGGGGVGGVGALQGQAPLGAVATMSTAMPAPEPSSSPAAPGVPSPSAKPSPEPSTSAPTTPAASPSAPASFGLLGGTVAGVVGGVAGLVGSLVGGLSGGSH